jgi:peptidoglycan/LPS O-acetylase OafA/YrhL
MLKPLTSLRFFAALLVFAYHCPLTMSAARNYRTGEAGVEFFFVLSGFILVYAHREFFNERLLFDRVRSFWVARFARIYPVHILTFAFGIYVVVHSIGTGWFWEDVQTNVLAFLTQITLTQSWVSLNSLFNFNSLAWSISDEMFFYAVFPLLALALFTLAKPARQWRMVLLAIALWGCSFAIAVGFHEHVLYTFPPVRLLDFAIGACFGVIFTGRSSGRPPDSVAVATLLEGAALAAVGLAIVATPLVPAPLRLSVWLAPFSAALIYLFALGNGLISRFLSWGGLTYLGEISYNFYMTHLFVIVIVFTYTKTTAPGLVSIISLVLCIAISTIIFERYERPLRDHIRRWLAPRIPKPVAIAREPAI